MNEFDFFKFIGKNLIFFGIFLVALGLFIWVLPNFGKIPHLGRLPGDIYIKKKNFSFYFPLATCVILSIVLTIILNIILRR